MLYLDNASTTLKKPFGVYASMMWNTVFGSVNAGRGGHLMSIKGTEGIIEAQDETAALFNIDNPQNIAFTLNATYALNMVMLGVLFDGGHVVVTEMEHNSVLRPAYRLGNYTVVKADESGYVSAEDVEKAITPDTKLVVCTHASNVCGTIQPVEEIGGIARKKGVLYLVDAAQTGGCLGTGGVYVKNPQTLEPVITGGTGSRSESLVQPDFMPDMLQSGTVNTPALKALAAGVRYIRRRGVEEISEKEAYLAHKMEENLLNMGGIIVYGRERRIGTTAFNIAGKASADTAQLLSGEIAVRAGYHCAPLAHRALGTEKIGAVRISFGAFNGIKDVEKASDAIWKVKKTG